MQFMRNLLYRFAPLALVAACSTISVVAQEKTAGPGPNFHYAYHLARPTESEHMAVNWNGVINWNKLGKEDQLWIQKGGKTYLITDKATLEAMRLATMPLRHSPPYSDTKKWHEQRDKDRQQVYIQTDKLVKEAIEKGLGKPAQMGR